MINLAPACLSDYVRGLNSVLLDIVTTIKERLSPIATDCPCCECDGRGYFVEYCTYAKASAPTSLLNGANGQPLTARRLVACYRCLGYGIDADKFTDACEQADDYQKKLEVMSVKENSRAVFDAEKKTQVGHRYKEEGGE